jgi:hypothetical protein
MQKGLRQTFVLAAVTVTTFFVLAPAAISAPIIDNGIIGAGRWEVDVLAGGETRAGILTPVAPPGATDVIFDYFHYVDVGANGGGVRLGNTTITMPPALTGPNQVTSAGTFAGQNGTISWVAVSSIAPGSPIYQTVLTFSSQNPFGSLRVIQYLDEDVLGISDDHLIVIGTPGTASFQLLTIDDNNNVGVSHAANYLSASNFTYIGWAADEFADLRNAITGAGASYSIPGVVDTSSLPPIVDPRFPGQPAFGPEDITSAIAFDINPNATSASVIFTLGGLPTGQPVVQSIPEPTSLLVFGAALAGVVGFARKRRVRV